MLKATPQLNRIFATCKENTLSPKATELVRLAAQLAGRDAARTGAAALRKVRASGASDEEVQCVACLSACTNGPATQSAFGKLLKPAQKNPFARVKADALDKKTTHLVSLAACLASGCECAAGHIVEARKAGAKEAELARVGCLAACVSGLSAKWSFAAALQCAEGSRQCAC